MKSITQKLLLSLGFKKEKVSAEESGDKPYKYFIFNLKNKRTLLITCTNDECMEKNNYIVEFFEDNTVVINNGKTLKKLCKILKNLKHD